MSEREIVHRFPVQPGLNVAIEDSLNILLEVTTPDGSEVIARSDVLSNIDHLKNMLGLARVWVSGAETDADAARESADSILGRAAQRRGGLSMYPREKQ